jgi:type II secretory pathway pseudopilin PulG
MMIVAIVIVSIILMILFFAVTVASGRAHDRANLAAALRDTKGNEKTGNDQDAPLG